jgi:hypothetical protein
MSIKSFALAGAAIIALTAGANVAQADDQDDEVRQLNIEQLEKARGEAGDTATTAPAPAPKPDGEGGPELQSPPTPDEGMTDDEPADEPVTDDEGADEPEADEPTDDQPEPK